MNCRDQDWAVFWCSREPVGVAALFDRHAGELPVAADFAATRLPLPPHQRFELARDEAGTFSFDVETRVQD